MISVIGKVFPSIGGGFWKQCIFFPQYISRAWKFRAWIRLENALAEQITYPVPPSINSAATSGPSTMDRRDHPLLPVQGMVGMWVMDPPQLILRAGKAHLDGTDEQQRTESEGPGEMEQRSTAQHRIRNRNSQTPMLLEAYPNPSDGPVYVVCNVPDGVAQACLRIMDLNGRLVREMTLEPGSGIAEIQPDFASPGIYVAELQLDGIRAGRVKLALQ
ncbi:MAG: T9SS type A sorting domain-containing protein [Flavobacteriales bacterium]